MVTALIAAVVTSLVPVLFAVFTGLWTAPARLADLERAILSSVRQDSIQTRSLLQMAGNIELLTLMRCMDRQGDPELYARLQCASVPFPTRQP